MVFCWVVNLLMYNHRAFIEFLWNSKKQKFVTQFHPHTKINSLPCYFNYRPTTDLQISYNQYAQEVEHSSMVYELLIVTLEKSCRSHFSEIKCTVFCDKALVLINNREILKTRCFHSVVTYSGIPFLTAKYLYYRSKLFRIVAGAKKS